MTQDREAPGHPARGRTGHLPVRVSSRARRAATPSDEQSLSRVQSYPPGEFARHRPGLRFGGPTASGSGRCHRRRRMLIRHRAGSRLRYGSNLPLERFRRSHAVPAHDRHLRRSRVQRLASPAYLAAGTPSPAVLLHGVGDLPEGKAVDAGLIYGDYYFIEALARLRAASPAGTDAGPVGGGPADAGGGVPSSPASSGGCASGSDAAIGALALLTCAPLRRRLRRKPSTVVEKRARS